MKFKRQSTGKMGKSIISLYIPVNSWCRTVKKNHNFEYDGDNSFPNKHYVLVLHCGLLVETLITLKVERLETTTECKFGGSQSCLRSKECFVVY